MTSQQLVADTTTRLQICQTIANDSERLDCYDAIAASPKNTEQQNLKTELQKQDFGKETWSKDNDKITQITATIEAVKKSNYGKQIISLSNQQTWKQQAKSNFKLRVGDKITIERGSLNAFFLSKDSSSKKEKFIRVH